ncbi:ABC transporter substrate-binding protein [Streptomyces sp. NPDC046924]|uniref:ABC transporter substrate-binding protein n=1 Tax=Streptomyces sp. NPDC046924 TaxID=3155136 RepID=UPI0033D9E31A
MVAATPDQRSAGTGGGNGGAGEGIGGQLTVDLDDWPLSLDPYHVVDFNQALVLDTLMDPLTREERSERTGGQNAARTVSGALESLESDDHGHTWRLRPAPGQTWDDGSPVLPTEIATGVHRAWGPTAFTLPDAFEGPRTRVRDDTDGPFVELTSPIPLPYLPELLAFPGAAPVREIGEGGWTASGPYRPVRADRQRGRIELHRTQSRRSRAHPGAAERIVFQVYGERADAVAAFDAGELDVCFSTGLEPSAFAELAGRADATVRPLALAGRLWVRPGIDSLLDTPEGRGELSAGLNREALSTALSGTVLPLHGYRQLWPGTTPDGGPSEYGHGTVPLRAPRGSRTELTLTYADFPPNGSVARALAHDIESRFGHQVRLRPLKFAAFAAAVVAVDYELLHCISPAPFAHPASLLTPFHSATPGARALGLCDRAVDAALERALRTPEDAGGAEAWREAEEIALRRAPVVPLFQANSITLCPRGPAAPEVASTGLVGLERMSPGPRRPQNRPLQNRPSQNPNPTARRAAPA